MRWCSIERAGLRRILRLVSCDLWMRDDGMLTRCRCGGGVITGRYEGEWNVYLCFLGDLALEKWSYVKYADCWILRGDETRLSGIGAGNE